MVSGRGGNRLRKLLTEGHRSRRRSIGLYFDTPFSSGVFGGQVLALQLNADFNDAGIIDGANGSIADLRLCNTGTSLDGMTISQILAAANVALGGGSLPTGYTYSSLNNLVTHLNEAFDNCNVSTWALEHLCR